MIEESRAMGSVFAEHFQHLFGHKRPFRFLVDLEKLLSINRLLIYPSWRCPSR